jgi:hypothetical protein
MPFCIRSVGTAGIVVRPPEFDDITIIEIMRAKIYIGILVGADSAPVIERAVAFQSTGPWIISL